jgi:SAM-dependent methyltransferase
VLDFGGGLGFFASALAETAPEVVLFDLDPKSRSYARDKFLGRVKVADTVEEALAGRFDVILLNQVVEHVPDPVGFLAQFRRALFPGGVLIVTTPNNDSADHWLRPDVLAHYYCLAKGGAAARFRGLATNPWLCCDPPRHLYAFGRKSLEAAGERAGLRPLKIETKWFDRDPYGQPKYRLAGLGSPKRAALTILYVWSRFSGPLGRLLDLRRTRGTTLIGYFGVG